MKDTKKAILDIASVMFAKGDYDSISTRDIAKRANVNISAISYYFGNKDGLYLEVIENAISFIKDSNESWVKLVLNFKISNNRDENLNNFLNILGAYVDCVINNTVFMNSNSIVLLKNSAKNNLVSNTVYNELFLPLNNILSRIFISITGLEPNNLKITFIVNMILGQMTDIAIHKDMILKLLGIKMFDNEGIEMLKRIFVEHARAIMNMYINEVLK